jgi:hypothetical protein
MTELIKALVSAPVTNICLVGGLLFLGIAVVGVPGANTGKCTVRIVECMD